MSTTSAVHVRTPRAGALPIEPARMGVWLFLLTEAMFFAALVSAYLVLREGSSTFGGPGGALSVGQGLGATGLLLLSSLCMSRASAALSHARGPRIVSNWTLRAVLLGALFLIVQGAEYRDLLLRGLSPRTNLFWSAFFVLTATHALHVLGGLAWLAVAWHGARRGEHALRIQLGALYWHFVGLVWIVLFVLLYL